MKDCLATANAEWGFWGTSMRNGYDPSLTWPVLSKLLAEEFALHPEDVRDLLDAKFGRHLADDLSFISGGPVTASVITAHIQARLADRGWRNWFEKAIRDLNTISA